MRGKAFLAFFCLVANIVLANVPVAHLDSSLCAGGDERHGSAVLFRHDGKAYALTADLLAPDSRDAKRFCRRLSFAGGPASPASLLVSDWGMGLALLQWTDQTPAADWPSLDQLLESETGAGDDVVLRTTDERGQPSEIAGGEVLADHTDRHGFAENRAVSEVQGANIDGNGVGGAVLVAGKLVALISGQYLDMRPGSPTMPTAWPGNGSEQHNHLLILNNESLAPWLRGYFANGAAFQAHWRHYAEDQTGEWLADKVAGGGFLYRLQCPTGPDSTHGAGGPGGDFPIGGGNGIGSGGGELVQRACRIFVSRGADALGDFPIAARAPWQQEILKALQSAPEIEVPFAYRIDEDTHSPTHRTFASLGQFLQVMGDTRWTPCTLLPGEETALRKQARSTGKAAVQQYAEPGVIDEKLNSLLRQIYLLATLLDSDGAATVKAADLDVLADQNGPYSVQWMFLYGQPPGHHNYHVREELLKLRALLPGSGR